MAKKEIDPRIAEIQAVSPCDRDELINSVLLDVEWCFYAERDVL